MTKSPVDEQLLNAAITHALEIADAQDNNLVAALLAEAPDAARNSGEG